MLFREMLYEEFLKIITFWIPSKELRHKIRDNAFERFGKKSALEHYDRKIYKGEDASIKLYNKLSGGKPTLICRYGSNEFFTMRNFLLEGGIYFPKALRKAMSDCAGFFPANKKHLIRFAKELHSFAKDIDILGVWSLVGEQEYCSKYFNKNTEFVEIDAISSIIYDNPWTKYLKNKKVLVIHPYSESIQQQYQKRELLFKNPDILPEFELIPYKAIQSIGEEKKNLPYKDWFEALEKMKTDISKIDFDIAIVGAGAYGIFLAHHCKMLGKQAVHMGGVTQLLFGISAHRWNDYPGNHYFFRNANIEYWTRPSDEEKPKGYEKVEDGCYW